MSEKLKQLYKTDRKEFFRLIGAKGGKAKVPKGFAKFSIEKHKAVTSKGGKASGKTDALQELSQDITL